MKSKVLSNNRITPDYNILKVQVDDTGIKPGQFFMLEIPDKHEHVMRRPFAAFEKTATSVSFLIKCVGTGTTIFRNLEAGTDIDVEGPFGNGYNSKKIKKDLSGEKRSPVFMTGSCGLASIYLLFKELEPLTPPGGLIVASGTSMTGEFRKLLQGDHPELLQEITEDGSAGLKGMIPVVFDRYRHENIFIICCGPTPMMKAVSTFCSEAGLPALYSLEAVMACGYGACYGCSIKTGSGMRRICKDGPVFHHAQIENHWDQLG